MTPKGSFISVLITCFNEASTIIQTIDLLIENLNVYVDKYELIIIDDCSTDNSVSVVKDYLLNKQTINIKFIQRSANKGFVENVFEAANIASGDYFWVVGGDCTVSQEACKALLSCVGSADVIIPYVKFYRGRGILRRIMSSLYSGIIRTSSGSTISYFNGSSIYLRSDFMREIKVANGFGYSAEILIKLEKMGREIIEVPVIYNEGKKSKSTALSLKHFFEIFLLIIRLFQIRFRKLL
jgi:glycosyltransferase involved in cell wall biosynthesis